MEALLGSRTSSAPWVTMIRPRSVFAVVALLALAHTAGAQRGLVLVRGVVFDSLRGRPLRDAFVTISGKSAITTDARGRFVFDSVLPGAYVITAQHAVLDSIGLSGLTTRATVTEDGGEVRLAVPSFETLWKLSCRGRAPRDSGIVFGTIRDATTGAPVADAAVELTWSDLLLDKKRRVMQRRWRIETRSNESGGYAICGVAPELVLRIHANRNANATGLIDLPALGARVQRRDLLIGPVSASNPSARGTISGVVTDANGHPIEGARIFYGDTAEVRSDSDGHFRLADVHVGTRQFVVSAIGTAAVVATADVTPRDTTVVAVRLVKVRALEPVRTTAARGNRVLAAEFDERRKNGFGHTRDSTDIVRHPQFINALREVPGLNVQYKGMNLTITVGDGKGGACAPDVFIDGARAGNGHLIDLLPGEVGGLEVYSRAAHIPARFTPAGIQPQCGAILVWTKYGFRNR
jgi:protocatechuate 3,4-dioxygenase beta subunit